MAVLTPKQALATCYEAGFRWNAGIVVMPAIGWAESRLRTDARGENRDPVTGKVTSVDRGWLQINSKYHPEVSDEQCDDPLEAAKAAYVISRQGTSFSPWSTFNSGAYKGPEGLTYALFMAEWRDFAAREILLPGKETEYKVLADRFAAQTTTLAATAAELKLVTDELRVKRDELATSTNLANHLAEEKAAIETQYEAMAQIARDRAVKIDNAKAALA